MEPAPCDVLRRLSKGFGSHPTGGAGDAAAAATARSVPLMYLVDEECRGPLLIIPRRPLLDALGTPGHGTPPIFNATPAVRDDTTYSCI
jgi:hypothetical protein